MGRFLVKIQTHFTYLIFHIFHIKHIWNTYFKVKKPFLLFLDIFPCILCWVPCFGYFDYQCTYWFCLYCTFETQQNIVVYSEYEWTKTFTLASASVKMQSGSKYTFAWNCQLSLLKDESSEIWMAENAAYASSQWTKSRIFIAIILKLQIWLCVKSAKS